MSEGAIRGPGVCAGLGTANTMHMAVEALGMALPGSTPVRANSPAMWDAVRAAGHRAVELVKEGRSPRSVLTPAAVRNAVTVMLAIGGSINSVKHLQAVAVEAGLDVDVWRLYEETGRPGPGAHRRPAERTAPDRAAGRRGRDPRRHGRAGSAARPGHRRHHREAPR